MRQKGSSELTVIIKDEEKTLRTKFLVYEDYQVNSEDPLIKDYVDQCIKNFNGTPESINVKINLIVE